MILYYHPLSSYCWKVLIAFYENGTPFTPRMMEADGVAQEWLALWPIGKFPLLRDSTRDMVVAEASIIIEYLATHEPGTFRPIPLNPDAALAVRMMDRLFDNYVMTPMQMIVADRLRLADSRDPVGVAQARTLIARAYALLETRIGAQGWAVGESFTLADCAAAPALFYANKIVPMGDDYSCLSTYLARLVARPSFARVLAEKEPWWPMFPFANG
jgi:glutathione S-transferase